MQCPTCSVALEPSELEAGLLAASCPTCNGSLLPLMNYRYWHDHQHQVSETAESVVKESSGAKFCPKCNKMMTKYRMGLESENRLELCSHCDEIWLDQGEWQLVKRLNIHECLPEIFTDAWQRNLRKKREAQHLREHYNTILGEEVFAKVEAFKIWLDEQPKKGEISHYLTIHFER